MYNFFDRLHSNIEFEENFQRTLEDFTRMENIRKMADWFKGEIERNIFEELFIISDEFKKLNIDEKLTNLTKEKIRLKAHKLVLRKQRYYYIMLSQTYFEIYPSKYEFANEAQENVFKIYYDDFRREVKKYFQEIL